MRKVLSAWISAFVLIATAMGVPSHAVAEDATLWVAYGPEGIGGPALGGPGTSCSDPGYRAENQEALSLALADAEAGDTVRICAGEYIYDGNGYDDPLSNGVSIVGAGIGETILNGANQYYLLSLEGGTDIEIRGITFAQGEDTYGAALTIEDTEATVIDSLFVGNTATETGEDYGGAGIYVYANDETTEVTVINSRFEGNVADEESAGGAINVWTDTNEVATLRVERSTFVGNEAGQGPAIYFDDFDQLDGGVSEITLLNNTFIQNLNTHPDDDSADGGAVAFEHTNGNLIMIGNTFTKNSGAYSGGAVEIWDVTGTIVVESNSFTRNVAGEGGALWIDVRNGIQHIRRNTFRGNTATNLGGAISFECETAPTRRVAASLERTNRFFANRATSRRTLNVYASEYGCIW